MQSTPEHTGIALENPPSGCLSFSLAYVNFREADKGKFRSPGILDVYVPMFCAHVSCTHKNVPTEFSGAPFDEEKRRGKLISQPAGGAVSRGKADADQNGREGGGWKSSALGLGGEGRLGR